MRKKIFNNFDFSNKSWKEFPKIIQFDKNDLTKEEYHLLSAIKIGWYLNEGGKRIVTKKISKGGIYLFMIVIGLISIYSQLSPSSPTLAKVKEISAATVSASLKLSGNATNGVNEIIESTMSAVLNH